MPVLRPALLWLLFSGCMGMASDFQTMPGPGGGGGAGGGGSLEEVDRPTVTLPLSPLKLLPFDVRLRRTATAVGVPMEDPVFDTARSQRLALGGHDFANGSAPDLEWNSQRMYAWVAAMLPVCRDARLRSYFGTWKEGGVEKFTQGAFGRASTADDLDDLSGTLAVSGDNGWVATCLSLTSSAELLLQ